MVPLTIPLLTGPATMSTMVIYAEKAAIVLANGDPGLGMVVVALATALRFRLAEPAIARCWVRPASTSATRLMGLIPAALAVEVTAVRGWSNCFRIGPLDRRIQPVPDSLADAVEHRVGCLGHRCTQATWTPTPRGEKP